MRRCAIGLLTLAAALVMLFLPASVLPGDVAAVVLGKDANPERVATLREQLNRNESVVTRCGAWVAGLEHRDLGDPAVQLARLGRTSSFVTSSPRCSMSRCKRRCRALDDGPASPYGR